MTFLKKTFHVLGDKFVVLILAALFMIFLNFFYPAWWKFLFSILLIYLLADIIKLLFIKFGKTASKFPYFIINKNQPRGHAYLIFLLFIVFGTLVSTVIVQMVLGAIEANPSVFYTVVPNLLLIVFVYVDFALAL